MHMEIQVALNFVISYLYNKLPRRRVNIFGEELEKALKDKFQGHWYPEKPYKGSAFRCLKTGDPIDPVLERAARESGVPITDILENLPNELSVWVDPGEVSYRIGEKGAVKILFSENNDNHEDNSSADREVNKTFNPEAQCFRPIDAINTSLNSLNLSPKTSPQSGSSPHSASSTSPTYKGSPNPLAASNGSFIQRSQAPLTFTTATFAQTKFGSTKLKTSSKRSNSSYRMSPTEFSNYIKQRAMQQQLHHGHGPATAPPHPTNHFGAIGHVSPARSLSPNPLSLGLAQNENPFYFPSMVGMYPQFNAPRNIFEAAHFHPEANNLYNATNQSKFNTYLDPHGFYGLNGLSGNHIQPQHISQVTQQSQVITNQHNGQNKVLINGSNSNEMINKLEGVISNTPMKSNATAITVTVTTGSTDTSQQNNTATVPTSAPTPTSVVNNSNASANAVAAAITAAANNQDTSSAAANANTKSMMEGLNSFYSNATGGSYQQLLVAN
ncbi:protein Tob1 isoform X2 [Teleopsis dalmanni]|uniref:protein Tob1 isoform X2 n=1 Tax=Teleopsis dalmanni TaxID=139649 RepID=UPI0018CE9EC5|nr:protein Tob1 isoform X2 [Teleopsis dalmanni]